MSAPSLLDLACETVASAPGTGSTLALSGTASTGGWLTWSNAGAVNGVLYRFYILDGTNRELATGVWNSSSNEFTNRTTLIASVGGTKQTTAINATSSAVVGSVALAEDILTDATAQSIIPGGYVNAHRNMGCDIDQRKTRNSALTVTTSGAYVTDGDIVLPTGASVTAGQAASQTGMLSANGLKVTGATSNTGVTVRRRIESIEVARAGMVGATVTAQCKIYHNAGAAITPTLSVGHPSTADTYSSVGAAALTNELSATNLQSCANAAVTTVAYTFALGSSAGNGLELNLNLGNNFASNSKSFQVTDWDIRVTPNVSTGLNNAPPPPELRPYSVEFLNCQRYLPGVSGSGAWGAISITGITEESICCTAQIRVTYFVIVALTVPTRVPVTGLSASGANQTITFGSASLSQFVSGAVSPSSNYAASLWGGSSSTSWAVFTGAEL